MKYIPQLDGLTRKLHKDFEKLNQPHRILVLDNFSKS